MANATAAEDALSSLLWSLTTFETPQPIAIDVSGVTEIADDFVEGFFGAIVRRWPESYFGPHTIVIVGADPALAPLLRDQLRACGFGAPVTARNSC